MDDVNRFTITKRTGGNYEIRQGYQAVIGEGIEVVYFTPVNEDDLSSLRKADTQEKVNEILSKYI